MGSARFDNALMKKLGHSKRADSLASNRSNDSDRSNTILRIKRTKPIYSPRTITEDNADLPERRYPARAPKIQKFILPSHSKYKKVKAKPLMRPKKFDPNTLPDITISN